ncbi:MAG: RtcB family protein, partial [Deltaproteobacteria bacterium]
EVLMEEMKLERLDDYRYLIPKEGGMRVPGLIFVDEKMLSEVRRDESLKQVRNVAHLPGIVGYSMAMPDMHEGYGFPIGGVAAFDMKTGVISPGGVGYDINCGVRLLTTNLQRGDIAGKMRELVDALFINVPSGVGSTSEMRLSPEDERKVFLTGARWAVENGYGTHEDLAHTEEGGCLDGADPSVISERAVARGRQQLGTVGSGNHFVEVGYVDEVFDEAAASAFGLRQGQVTVFVHCGSRGFGYQVCDDFLFKMGRTAERQGITLPDRQLACAYINSPEGQEYYSAMACAANYAWANRQMLMHWVRETFMRVLNIGPRDLGMRLLYDVCHNIAKFETHKVNGKD